MNLTHYINDLQQQLESAAEPGGEEARALAERLIAPLESAMRLVLLEALSDAASEITRELAPGSVDVRLRGREPEFVVTSPTSAAFAEVGEIRAGTTSGASRPSAVETDEGGTWRTTLRLPESFKLRVEETANREGISVNAWLVRIVAAALEPKNQSTSERTALGERFTGWVR